MEVIKFKEIYYTLLPDKTAYVGRQSGSGPNAIDTNYTFKDIVIPETISYSENNYTVEGIYGNAFYNYKMENLTLPNSIKFIGPSAIDMTYIEKEIILPQSLEIISDWGIASAEFQTITIPPKVKYIGNGALGCNKKLITIHLSEDNQYFKIIDTVLYSSDLTSIIQAPTTLTNITIPDSVRIIQAAAFSCSNLTELIIPASVKVINKQIVDQCKKLKRIYILGNVKITDTPIGSTSDIHKLELELLYYQGTKAITQDILWDSTVATITVCHGYQGNQFGETSIVIDNRCEAISPNRMTCEKSICPNYHLLYVILLSY